MGEARDKQAARAGVVVRMCFQEAWLEGRGEIGEMRREGAGTRETFCRLGLRGVCGL